MPNTVNPSLPHQSHHIHHSHSVVSVIPTQRVQSSLPLQPSLPSQPPSVQSTTVVNLQPTIEETLPVPTRALAARSDIIPIASDSAAETNVDARMTSRAHSSKKVIDPLCIGITQRDPMYAIATPAVKKSIEAEEARILEAKLSDLYKCEAGRSRGWVKTHIEAFLIPRAASGSQFVGSNTGFEWSKIWTDKQTSAILDYICLAKNIRLAVWKDDVYEIGLWPAADSNQPQDTQPSLYHVTESGVFIDRPDTIEGRCIRAPMAFEHALDKLTISELDNVGKGIGLMNLVGKKTDRVRVITTTRMTMRLRGSS